MKKIILLLLISFSFSANGSAQQKNSSSFLDKIQNKIPAYNLRTSHAHKSHPSHPSPNSIWQPGKMISSSWDTAGSAWMFRDSVIYSYNVNGSVTRDVRYSSFGISDQTVYTYNANEKLIDMLWQSWNGSSWDNDWKDTFMYDANDNLIQYLSQSWNGGSWDNDWKDTYKYDANGNLIQYLSQSWNGGSWDNKWQDDYTYNASNQMTQIIGQTWNGASWDNDYKIDLTNNGAGVFISAIVYIWNGASWDKENQLINIIWYQWTGNLFTSLLQSITGQEWISNAWQNSWRETYAYDAQGNETDYLSEEWQITLWVIDWKTKDIYTYDANNNISQDIYQDWVQWLSAVRNYMKYDYSNYTLYSAVNESTSANDNILVYPNPSNGKANVKISQFENLKIKSIELYNVYGEKIYDNNHFQINSSSNFQIDLSEAPDGIYFIHIRTEQETAVKKLIIQK